MPQRTAPVRPLHPDRPHARPAACAGGSARDPGRRPRQAAGGGGERRRPGRSGTRASIVGAAAGVLVLLVGLPLLLAFGPVFPVRTIQVTRRLRRARRLGPVRPPRASSADRSRSVDDADVARALAALPAVERFTLVRRPPGTLEVAVVARTAARAAADRGRLGAAGRRRRHGLDRRRAGRRAARADVPAGTADAGGRRSPPRPPRCSALAASDPPVTTVRATSPDDVELTLRGGLRVQWGGAEDGAAKAEALHAALRKAAKGATEIDVSSPGVVLTR